MDKILYTKLEKIFNRQNSLEQSKQGLKIEKIVKQVFLVFLTKYVYIFFSYFLDKVKIALEVARCES